MINDENYFCAMDLVPSILSIAGVKTHPDQGFDGEDVSATLLGLQRRSRTAPIFWRRPPDRPGTKQEDYPDLAMRDGKWKLLCEYDGSNPQLYDLRSDAIESQNVAEAHGEVVERMRLQLDEWNKAMPSDRGPELELDRPEN